MRAKSWLLVSAGLALAWDEHAAGALARAIGEGVQDTGDYRIPGQDPTGHDRDGGERDDESNH